jgi:hypothetical protein
MSFCRVGGGHIKLAQSELGHWSHSELHQLFPNYQPAVMRGSTIRFEDVLDLAAEVTQFIPKSI